MMKGRILRALLRKEIIMIKRNPLVPRIIFMLPIMTMLVIPLVATLDVKHVGIAVVDNDHSQLSRRIISDINASEYLSVVAITPTYETALRTMEEGDADVILTIPEKYGEATSQSLYNANHYGNDASRRRQTLPQVSIEANGVNATKGTLGAQYTAQSVVGTLQQYLDATFPSVANDTTASSVAILNMYNPTLTFRNYMIPALIVILLIMICGFLPTLNIVGEKESGTIEAMNVTPVGRFTFVLSKLIPYWVIGLIVVTIGMLIGWAVYGLRPQGSVLGFYVAAVLFSLVMSGFGVLVANKSDTMMQSIFVMFAIIMIFQLMSGLFTPITSMPQWAQYITYAVPPRYFIEIMRAVYLRGTPITELGTQFAALATFALLFCTAAALTYRKQQ